MLKTLTRLHSPALLHTLASMGHGDELAVVDAHFPATSLARRLVRLDGADLPDHSPRAYTDPARHLCS